jgi:hypothetical protein
MLKHIVQKTSFELTGNIYWDSISCQLAPQLLTSWGVTLITVLPSWFFKCGYITTLKTWYFHAFCRRERTRLGLRTVPNTNASRGVSSHRPSTATASGCKLSQAANIHNKMPIQPWHNYGVKATQHLTTNPTRVRFSQATFATYFNLPLLPLFY